MCRSYLLELWRGHMRHIWGFTAIMLQAGRSNMVLNNAGWSLKTLRAKGHPPRTVIILGVSEEGMVGAGQKHSDQYQRLTDSRTGLINVCYTSGNNWPHSVKGAWLQTVTGKMNVSDPYSTYTPQWLSSLLLRYQAIRTKGLIITVLGWQSYLSCGQLSSI